MPLFLVESLSQFRIRHVVEADCLDHALDHVTMDELNGLPLVEFSQKHLGTTILGGRPITESEFTTMLAELANKPSRDEMSSHWMGYDLINRDRG